MTDGGEIEIPMADPSTDPPVVGDIVERVKPSGLAPGPRGIIVWLKPDDLPYVVRWPDGTETGYRASEIRHAATTTAPQPWICPVQSNECAIRRQCTNKCGRNDYQRTASQCYQDPAHSTAWCAVHHEVPDWHSDAAGWVCAAGGPFDAAKGAAARAEHDAKFAADPPADTAPPSQRACTPYAHHWVAGSRTCQCGAALRDGDCRFWRTESRLTDEEFLAALGGQR